MNQHQNIEVENVRESDLWSGGGPEVNMLRVTVPVTVELFFDTAADVTPERIHQILEELVREDTENVLALRTYGLEAPLVRDRPHRFAVGQEVSHVDERDAEGNRYPLEVLAQTWRMRDGVAYPTYTLADMAAAEEVVEDVLDTLDIVDFQELLAGDEEIAR